jgi:hypothetical protein
MPLRKITAAFLLSVAAQWVAAESIPTDAAEKAFAVARQINADDGGRLWGVPVCGPLILADPQTRDVVANQADREGKLTQKGSVWVGKLPDDLTPANSAAEWAGVRWTMLMWPIPTEPRDRRRLLAHECFHRVQNDLKLPATDANNGHLDSKDGRIWIQLEGRALERALCERGAARVQAVRDALAFRGFRRALIEQAATRENALEMNEGLAEYTGYRLASSSAADRRAGVIANLHDGPHKQTFVRSFAYVSGPAYGVLLDESGLPWRGKLQPDSDIGALLAKAYGLRTLQRTQPDATAAAKEYQGEELMAVEEDREIGRQARIADIRKRFVEGSVLLLPPFSKFSYGFDPNNVVSLDEDAAFYPWVRVTDEWGVLEARGGLLVRGNGQIVKVVVPAANVADGTSVTGNDWKLDLAPGWKIVPAERSGDQTVKKEH